MSNPIPVEQKVLTPQEELSKLYTEKGELVTQLEVGQAKLMGVNQRINQLLGLTFQQVR